MLQVICPGCAKLIEVGELPPGTLPSCPFCRTVFQLSVNMYAQEPGAVDPGHVDPTRTDLLSEQLHDSAGHESSPRWLAASWGLIVLLLFGVILATTLLLGVTALLDHKQRQAEQQAAADPTGTWQKLAEFSGRGPMYSKRFRVAGPVWRMNWNCQVDETPSKKSFDVHVMDDGDKLLGSPIGTQGDGDDAVVMENGPGTFYLVIKATNVRWSVTVEQLR